MSVRFSRSFLVSELACHDGTPVPSELYPNALAICERAQVLHDFLNLPFKVKSGFRTAAHNTKVGGAPKSQHLTASALDLATDGWTGAQLARVYEGLIRHDLVKDGGLGIYPWFIHIDLALPRRWTLPGGD